MKKRASWRSAPSAAVDRNELPCDVASFWRAEEHNQDGEVFWLYVLLYAISRGILETWRGDLVRGFVIPGILSTSQFIGLLTAALAAGMLFYLSRRSRATA